MSTNRERFYLLSLQPTLMGEVAVVRSWGGIGTPGNSRAELRMKASSEETWMKAANHRMQLTGPGEAGTA